MKRTGDVGNGTILLVQPWIHDFAAFDLWQRPLALLRIARILRRAGFRVQVIDLLDRCDPRHSAPPPRGPLAEYGCGQYHAVLIEKPEIYSSIPRRYRQYGMPEEAFRSILRRSPQPDIVGVSSGMTYWAGGVARTIEIIKSQWPSVAVVLGGTYARLLPDHARRYSGADEISLHSSHRAAAEFLAERVGKKTVQIDDNDDELLPDYSFLSPRRAFSTVSSVGCCFSCPYCAANRLTGGYRKREIDVVVDEIETYRRMWGATDVAFYDDALLLNAPEHLLPILRHFEHSLLRFHAPNGLHARLISDEAAQGLYRAGFQTVRLGLEVTGAMQNRLGGKVTNEDIEAAASALVRAGYTRYDIETYVMMGLPGQTPLDVVDAMLFVHRQRLMLRLNEFSPIPGTPLFQQAAEESGLNLEEPLLQNNSTYSFMHRRFHAAYFFLKNLLHALNNLIRQGRSIDGSHESARRSRQLIAEIEKVS